MKHCLVTGATGFIGSHLVGWLHSQGIETTCLVRPTSDRQRLEAYHPRFVVGSLHDRDAINIAITGVDTVFHLAGLTKSLNRAALQRANAEGSQTLAECCASRANPPTFVHVSSLAAAGPSRDGHLLVESDEPSPVSAYGRSKLSSELAVARQAAVMPISIVRPPIVIGPGDRDGFEMFRAIQQWRVHVAPGRRDTRVSIIHAEDLVQALQRVASSGRRIVPGDREGTGIYFAADDQSPTYADLGRQIGQALDLPKIRVVHSPGPLVWTIAGVSELISQIRRKPNILNLDKAREATAGSWICSADKLRAETGFQPAFPLQERLKQTAQWYREHGWLKSR